MRYTVAAVGATFRPFKNMISVFNGSGSGKILNIQKVWILNNQSVAVTGAIDILELRKITSISGGGAITSTKHSSLSASLPAQINIAEGAICTLDPSVFRRVFWSTDEPLATVSSMDEIAIIPKWNIIWETLGDLEPIVLNEGQGVSVYYNTNASIGQADFFIEFTVA